MTEQDLVEIEQWLEAPYHGIASSDRVVAARKHIRQLIEALRVAWATVNIQEQVINVARGYIHSHGSGDLATMIERYDQGDIKPYYHKEN